jgi:universal protein Kae1
MICLGIEGTAHTLGMGIVQDTEPYVLANLSNMYLPSTGGIHPRDAANHHGTVFIEVLSEVLQEAKISLQEVEAIGFSIGPGLGPCLRTVATAARSLALLANKPLVGVNHCIAHLEIGRILTDARDPVLLYVSGGNTQVIAFLNSKYRVFGETLDIGIGNCLDKFGRAIGMPFPAGPAIEKEASKGSRYVPLPYSVKGMDVAFSGILTAALACRPNVSIPDLCFSLQETCFAMLTEVTERAMAHTDKNEVLLGGGVAANQRFRHMVTVMAEERGGRAYWPPIPVLVDNGAMIAWTALLMYQHGMTIPVAESHIKQNYRTDEVTVPWRN